MATFNLGSEDTFNFGSQDADVFFAQPGSGDNVIANAFGGDDLIDLGPGDDFANGGSGNDTILGRNGDDTLYGGQGNDALFGEFGDDHLHGGSGNDLLIGSFGNDYLDGGSGNDRLIGLGDNDILHGGSDSDNFDFLFSGGFEGILGQLEQGRDTIDDFEVGLDHIRVNGLAANQIRQFDVNGDGVINQSDQGAHVSVDTAGDVAIRLSFEGLTTTDGGTASGIVTVHQADHLNVGSDFMFV